MSDFTHFFMVALQWDRGAKRFEIEQFDGWAETPKEAVQGSKYWEGIRVTAFPGPVHWEPDSSTIAVASGDEFEVIAATTKDEIREYLRASDVEEGVKEI